jgi:hypothetical protein
MEMRPIGQDWLKRQAIVNWELQSHSSWSWERRGSMSESHISDGSISIGLCRSYPLYSWLYISLLFFCASSFACLSSLSIWYKKGFLGNEIQNTNLKVGIWSLRWDRGFYPFLLCFI